MRTPARRARSAPRRPELRTGRARRREPLERTAWRAPDLKGRVAVVTGASRGGGRGIALVLGETGATVYVTGRSSVTGSATRGLPRTVESTAAEIEARGGRAVAVRCDHTNPRTVEALFDRVRDEQGRLDILVNNVWGGYERNEAGLPDGPFWSQPLWSWESMFEAGLHAHFLSTRFALPIMPRRRGGLIVHTIAWDRGKYLGNLYYDVAKQAIRRFAYGLALELRGRGIASVALAPGWMRTELVLEAHRKHPFSLARTESTEYIGRAVASLAADPDVKTKSGAVLAVGDLAREYGFSDVDGRRIPPFRIPKHHLRD